MLRLDLNIFFVIDLLSFENFLQVVQPKLQRRRLAFAKHKHVRSRILKYLKQRALGRLMDESGGPNKKVLEK